MWYWSDKGKWKWFIGCCQVRPSIANVIFPTAEVIATATGWWPQGTVLPPGGNFNGLENSLIQRSVSSLRSGLCRPVTCFNCHTDKNRYYTSNWAWHDMGECSGYIFTRIEIKWKRTNQRKFECYGDLKYIAQKNISHKIHPLTNTSSHSERLVCEGLLCEKLMSEKFFILCGRCGIWWMWKIVIFILCGGCGYSAHVDPFSH